MTEEAASAIVFVLLVIALLGLWLVFTIKDLISEIKQWRREYERQNTKI